LNTIQPKKSMGKPGDAHQVKALTSAKRRELRDTSGRLAGRRKSR